MAAIVAHEVKNPIAGIRGALQVIGGRMPAESRERAVLGDILARLDSLNTIVQDLLLFARPRPLNLAKVEMRPLLGATATLLKRDPEFAALDVSVDGAEIVIAADREQLQTVFLNLMLNAAQATGGTGRVDVSVARRDGWCEVAVRDTGPGIAEDVREKMFEPFFTTKHRGSGLGLAIARRVVELHRGDLEAECPPEGGTIMRVRLPIRE
jgi:signal transduction histidine kinase